MYNMVGSYRSLLQISKQDKIGNEIDRYDKTVPVFFYFTSIIKVLQYETYFFGFTIDLMRSL